jgi:6-phosphofructokinase 1
VRVAILTSGGDAPGMNAAVDAFRRGAEACGIEPLGIREGWTGLLQRRAAPLDPTLSARFARLGGTWLAASRVPDLAGRMAELVAAARTLDLRGLVVLGGDGSLRAAGELAQASGLAVIGIPATIDNDVAATEASIGFDTAVAFAVEVVDRARDSMESLPRFFAVETLGGPTGHLALAVGRLAAADAILLPEAPTSFDDLAAAVSAGMARGSALAVASEGVADLEATLARAAEAAGTRLRFVRLGHAQRGGAPSPRDRAIAIASAVFALEAIREGRSGVAGLSRGALRLAPFDEAVAAPPPDRNAWRGLL